MQLTRTQIDEKILGVNLSAFVMTTMTFLKTTLIPAVLSRNYKRQGRSCLSNDVYLLTAILRLLENENPFFL